MTRSPIAWRRHLASLNPHRPATASDILTDLPVVIRPEIKIGAEMPSKGPRRRGAYIICPVCHTEIRVISAKIDVCPGCETIIQMPKNPEVPIITMGTSGSKSPVS